MKKIVYILVFVSCVTANAQIGKTDYPEALKLTAYTKLTAEQQMIIVIQTIIHFYGKSFKYHDELVQGKYEVSENKGVYTLNIFTSGDKNSSNAGTVSIKLKTDYPEGRPKISFDIVDVERHLNNIPLNAHSPRNYVLPVIERDNILIDKQILMDDNIPSEHWKILNKTFTTSYLENSDGDPAVLFKDIIAGTIIPYTGGHKLLTIDKGFHSSLYFDSEILNYPKGTPINDYYGIFGDGNGEFWFPTDITTGREINSSGVYSYPIYIVDSFNDRIIKVNFVINTLTPQLAHYENSTFTVFSNANTPYGVAYFKHLTDESQDKIWVSEANPAIPHLSCYNADGVRVQRLKGYYFALTQQYYPFEENTISRLAVYNDYFSAITFVDNIRNAIVSCKLNSNGTAMTVPYEGGELIVANDVLFLTNEYPLNSVSFYRTPLTYIGWPFVLATSGSHFHLFRMNTTPALHYLASTNLPKNTDQGEGFTNLINTISTNGSSEIFTLESWNFSYGLRKYSFYADIYSDTLLSGCNDSLLYFKASFTNDCWLYMQAYRLNNDDNWELVKIKKFNGIPVNEFSYIKWQFAGWNQMSHDLYVNLNLDLPIEDLALGAQVKLVMKMFPEDEFPNPFSLNYVPLEYFVDIQPNCLPKPGGCPFLYVKDENNNFTPDNNLLHKMEYSTPETDITDKYKLRVKPLISGGKIETYIVENEDDLSLVDQVKMYAVDYPPDRKVAVTEYNQVVLYDSAVAYGADTVLQNYTVNVTNDLHFHHPGAVPLVGNAGDSMYAHFNYFVPQKIKKTGSTDRTDKSKIDTKNDKLEERAFSKQKYDKLLSGIGGTNLKWAFISDIGNLTYPIPSAKDTAGLLTATSVYNNVTAGIFSRRELNSVVVLPLFTYTDMVNNIDIKWQSDHRMKYLGIAALEYGGYDINELPLAEANYITDSLDNEITATVLDIDGEYTEVSPLSLLKMKFDASGLPELTEDNKREYIFEVTGQYSGGQSSDHSRKSEEIPLTYRLSQNYPNPFNPVTKINYELPKNSNVNLVIYDILGREVIRLLNNEFKQPGKYTVEFDGKNFASGIYFYRIEAGNFVQSKKMVLLK